MNRHQPRELALREHKAADVLAQVARKTQQLHGEVQPLQHRPGLALQACLPQLAFNDAAAIKPEMLFGKLFYQFRCNAQCLTHVAQGTAGPVAGDGGGNGGAVMAVLFIDVLDDFFTPLVLKVHINVGRFAALPADETFKQGTAFSRIDSGDAQAIAHRRVGRRAAPLAQDALCPRKAHDVMDGDEIHLVLQLNNQRQLVRQLGLDGGGHTARVAQRCALGCQAAQTLRRALLGGGNVTQRIAVQVTDFIEAKAAARCDAKCGGQQPGWVQNGQPHAVA